MIAIELRSSETWLKLNTFSWHLVTQFHFNSHFMWHTMLHRRQRLRRSLRNWNDSWLVSVPDIQSTTIWILLFFSCLKFKSIDLHPFPFRKVEQFIFDSVTHWNWFIRKYDYWSNAMRRMHIFVCLKIGSHIKMHATHLFLKRFE